MRRKQRGKRRKLKNGLLYVASLSDYYTIRDGMRLMVDNDTSQIL
jgi:hypothetical protein